MEVKELIKAGKLSEARQHLVATVKNSPADPVSRTLLFQVLCYCGEWDKADRHLQALSAQDISREAGTLGFRNLIHAEQERHKLTENNQVASFLGEPPAYLDLFISAREKLGGEKIDEAADLFNRLESLRPAISGTLNNNSFTGLRDTDSFLVPFLEVFVHERYLWIPFESLRELCIDPPQTLLDLLWIPANVTTWEGLTMNCSLPVLYPDSFLHEDEQIKMGRMTDWISLGGPFARGVGQHVFEAGGEDISLLEIRKIIFNFTGNDIGDGKNN